MTDVDIYEFKETLEGCDGEEEWIERADDKFIGLVDVEKAPKEVKEQLKQLGYKDEDRVLVILQ